MRANPNRRFFLTAGLGMVAALPGLRWSPASGAQSSLEATPLGDRLTVLSGAGGNVLVARDSDGLVMVDSGAPGRTAEVMAAIGEIHGDRPVRTVFNTHWHLDHTGGNAPLARQGAAIIAQENTRRWMGMEFHVPWQDRTYEPRPPEARPTRSFQREGDMPFGGETLRYGHLPRAHTDGDLYVLFPQENVIAAGDVVSVGQYPVLDYTTGGWLGEMAEATQTLLEMSDGETRIVPGTGPIVGRDHLQAQYDMLSTVLERLVAFTRKGMSADEMIADGATAEFDAAWGDPTLFVHNAYRGFYGHFRDLRIA